LWLLLLLGLRMAVFLSRGRACHVDGGLG
jgi:hypothetical protein